MATKKPVVRLSQGDIDALESHFSRYASWWRQGERFEGREILITGQAWAEIKAHPLFPKEASE